MTEHDLLINGFRLEVWKCLNGAGDVCLKYMGAEVKEGAILKSVYGKGANINFALQDYYRKIKGKTLVFNAMSESRKEVIVI